MRLYWFLDASPEKLNSSLRGLNDRKAALLLEDGPAGSE